MKPIDPTVAHDDAVKAFDLAYAYRNSDASVALVRYLESRLAYYQAALVDSGDDTETIQRTARVIRDLCQALTAPPEQPRSVI